MEVCQMRHAISEVYDGKKWRERVKWMKDSQVIAIYNSFLKSGKFQEKREIKHSDCYQLTLKDLYKEI